MTEAEERVTQTNSTTSTSPIIIIVFVRAITPDNTNSGLAKLLWIFLLGEYNPDQNSSLTQFHKYCGIANELFRFWHIHRISEESTTTGTWDRIKLGQRPVQLLLNSNYLVNPLCCDSSLIRRRRGGVGVRWRWLVELDKVLLLVISDFNCWKRMQFELLQE